MNYSSDRTTVVTFEKMPDSYNVYGSNGSGASVKTTRVGSFRGASKNAMPRLTGRELQIPGTPNSSRLTPRGSKKQVQMGSIQETEYEQPESAGAPTVVTV